jgi:hypothetical protein
MAVRDIVQAAAGVGGGGEYVEDVFSTYLYQGNSASPPVITNGIDLADSGGMVWIKARPGATDHTITDTERGAGKEIYTNQAWEEQNYTGTYGINSFNSDGFSLIGNNSPTNTTAYTYASWTFRKAPKFFDVVTYTGNGVAGREIAHNLGSAPGMVIVKRTNATQPWYVYHRSLGNSQTVYLNLTDAAAANTAWNNTSPTATDFTVSDYLSVNGSGDTYVAYLFAHDAGGFGDDGEQNIISCGSYTGTGAIGNAITLGYEPQWVMIKEASGTSALYQDWYIYDAMRGMPVGTSTNDQRLMANLSSAEASYPEIGPTATGFVCEATGARLNESGGTYIYIAIRRPMKTPESGTEVFAPIARTGTNAAANITTAGFPPDLLIGRSRLATTSTAVFVDRLRGHTKFLQSAVTDAEGTSSSGSDVTGFLMNGFSLGTSGGTDLNTSGASEIYYPLKRAPSVFDVVATPQTAAGAGTVTHNLGVAPEFIILKGRDYTESWRCYHAALGRGAVVQLNLPDAPYAIPNYWGTADPTATEFGVSWNSFTAPNYIAYLFASCPGVSKVSSYTGTGADLNVDCGFSAGARFILIKRTDPGSTGDWYVWDSARGIVAGNDPYLLLNDTAAEVTATDYIDPLASGFTVTSSAPAALNASGGSYIFLAIS